MIHHNQSFVICVDGNCSSTEMIIIICVLINTDEYRGITYFPERQHTLRRKRFTPLLFGTFKQHPRVPLKHPAKFPAPSLRPVWFEFVTFQCFHHIFSSCPFPKRCASPWHNSPTTKGAETQTSQTSSENVVTLTRILIGTGYCCIF